jgi:hypothetical protein
MNKPAAATSPPPSIAANCASIKQSALITLTPPLHPLIHTSSRRRSTSSRRRARSHPLANRARSRTKRRLESTGLSRRGNRRRDRVRSRRRFSGGLGRCVQFACDGSCAFGVGDGLVLGGGDSREEGDCEELHADHCGGVELN